MSKITMEQLLDGMLKKNGLRVRSTATSTYYQIKVVDSMYNLIQKIQKNHVERIIDSANSLKTAHNVVKFYFDIMTTLFGGSNNSSRVVIAIAFMMEVMRMFSTDDEKYDKFYDLSLPVLKHQINPHVKTIGGWVSFIYHSHYYELS